MAGNSHIYYMAGESIYNNIIIDSILFENVENDSTIMSISSSTAMGFRPEHKSKTGAFSMVYDYLEKNQVDKLVLNFGQVDMDTIYPSMCVDSTREYMTPENFIDMILNRYLLGILELKKKIKNIVLLGINPPSLRETKNIFTNIGAEECFEDYMKYPYDFSLESRTVYSKMFNTKLNILACEHDMKYEDMWCILYDEERKTLKPEYFHPDTDDHHAFFRHSPSWLPYFWKKMKDL